MSETDPRLLPAWMDEKCAYCDQKATLHDPNRAGQLVCREHSSSSEERLRVADITDYEQCCAACGVNERETGSRHCESCGEVLQR